MSNPEPRGTVARVYSNRDGELVCVITWKRGEGPASVVADLREGQLVTVRGGKVVPV